MAERGIDISHETVRFWWNRFGPMFAAEFVKRRVAHVRGYPQWRWHLDEVFVKVNGKLCYLWRGRCHATEFGRVKIGSLSSGSGRGGGSPRPERFISEDAERAAGHEMALDVERVLDGSVNRQNRWADPGDLKRCIFRSRRRVG